MVSEPAVSILALTVSDIKQFVYCPRVVYFTYALPGHRPTTYKMEEGKLEHDHVAEMEERRSLRAYGLKDGERQFNVSLYSRRLGLSGRLDMVIITRDEIIPVDFKESQGNLGLNHKYQLAAYALLVEDRWERPVRRGFIYFIPRKRAEEVPITPNARRFVKETMAKIRDMLVREAIPPLASRFSSPNGRCTDCEFRNFCGGA